MGNKIEKCEKAVTLTPEDNRQIGLTRRYNLIFYDWINKQIQNYDAKVDRSYLKVCPLKHIGVSVGKDHE